MNTCFLREIKEFEWDFTFQTPCASRSDGRDGSEMYSIFFMREYQTHAVLGEPCGKTGARGDRPSLLSRA